MPIRMLRDWTNSDRVNILTVQAERFFVRLIMKVDDYGCFYADTRLLKANLFPLLLDSIREADLLRWTAECRKAGLIVLYENANKKFLQIVEFNQRMDKAKSKFPLPTSTDFPESVSTSRKFPAETETEYETEYERKPKGEGGDKNNFSVKNEKENTGLPGAEISMPFAEEFNSIWIQWKAYKSKEFGFKYKSEQSEQASINELITLSSGVELTAIEIIKQSMAKGWKGFFELKKNQNGEHSNKNGKQTAKITGAELDQAFAKRYS